MVAIRNLALLLVAGLLAAAPGRGRSEVFAADRPTLLQPSLFAQAAAATLKQKFSDREVSFLLLDASTGAVLALRWDDPEKPIPLGSLVKPFAALAYGEQHQFRYPTHTCRGTATGCWLPRGHGPVNLDSAIAHSCNSYFRALTANLTAAEVSPLAVRFGLQPPSARVYGPALAGLGNEWLISPVNMARAYLELLRRRDQPGARQILAGMAESARQGTGLEVDRALPYPDALVKTGTAACAHREHGPGDGFVVAITPAEKPQTLLMVRVHGVAGAQAARTAGKMLREIQQ